MTAVKGMRRWRGQCARCGRAITGGIVRDGANTGAVRLLRHRSEVRGTAWCEGTGSIVPCTDPDLGCAVAGCLDPVHAKRLCREHYFFNAAYGDPCAPRRRDRAGHELAMMTDRLQQVADIDLAYAAGLIDGEGCVTVEAPGTDKSGRWKAGRVKIIVQMTTPDVLRWLKETFGGCFQERKTIRPWQQPVHYWAVTGKQAGLLLEHLLPYMRVKGPQAKVAITFYRAQLPHTTGQRASPEYLAVLRDLKAQMLELNKRGVAA
jgi:hypothetical protein